ncbi:MAG: rRNA maturation RNase YbeY [Lachnospiraceae bacterium]|jgi:probable rRNA maturation factor|nr:rRNA maturation RNase YbeY [Lachnospiraceae bacterium]
MTFYVENENEMIFPFDVQEIGSMVARAVLAHLSCPYETTTNLLLTNDEQIKELNANFRQVDAKTDVLSFPNLEFETPGIFDLSPEEIPNCFDPDTKECILGDIVISTQRVVAQANEYNHSLKREFAFLVAHSMLHLCGFDHELEEDAKQMETLQEEILTKLNITRDQVT